MNRRRLLRALSVATFVLLYATLCSGAALAQTSAAALQAGLYRMTPASNFVEGCFDPCMCVVQYHEALSGTLRLTPAAPEPGFTVYNVAEVGWLVGRFDHWVTGSGTYRIGGQPLMHRLTLDLQVGDRPVEHYDSGLTPVGTPVDRDITISISKNNLVCIDTVFSVTLRPLLAHEIATYGLRQSMYEEGCFGPCDCPVRMQPFVGRFGLVRLDGNTAVAVAGAPGEFGVVDLRGSVLDPNGATSNAGSPVTGSGLYRVDAATGRQRLRLALLEDGAGPTRFDSGDIAWAGSLKVIDADVAEHSFACTDRVYSIHARRKPRSSLATQAIAPEPVRPGVIPAP